MKRMKQRFGLSLAIAALFSVLLVGTVMAASAYSASGALEQTDAGITEEASTEILRDLGLWDEAFDVEGLLTSGQQFEGKLDSNWGALKNTDISVIHNGFVSFFDEPTFATGVEPIWGVAFGEFTVTKGRGNRLVGSYAAEIEGVLYYDESCPVDPAFGIPLGVSVTDTGAFQVSDSHGALRQLSGGGELTVTATGCMGEELAEVSLSGVR